MFTALTNSMTMTAPVESGSNNF